MRYFLVEGSAVPGPGPRSLWANAFTTREQAGMAALGLVPEGPYVIVEAADLVALREHLQQAPPAREPDGMPSVSLSGPSGDATEARPPRGGEPTLRPIGD
jgi:hypothetical protein